MTQQKELGPYPKPEQPVNPPIFNLPPVIFWFAGSLVFIHTMVTLALPEYLQTRVLFLFAFIPLAYSLPTDQLYEPLARYWTPVTHGFLHADWTHLGVNVLWLIAFGGAVAKRFKTVRFLAFMMLSTAAGALAHYVFHPESSTLVIGASGAVSACMGAAARFAFTPGRFGSDERLFQPALPLVQSLINPGILAFVGVWFAINFLFGTGLLPVAGTDLQVAWEAHMGGFVFGLLAFALFDPVRRTSNS